MHSLCFTCGKIGHNNSTSILSEDERAPANNLLNHRVVLTEDRLRVKGVSNGTINHSKDEDDIGAGNGIQREEEGEERKVLNVGRGKENQEGYGPWILVSMKRSSNKNQYKAKAGMVILILAMEEREGGEREKEEVPSSNG